MAVTVDAENALLDEIVAAMHPDMLQLHGRETPARVAEVKARYGLPVMKALSVSEAGRSRRPSSLFGHRRPFPLLDAKTAQGGGSFRAGNGVSFDWRILKALDGRVGLHAVRRARRGQCRCRTFAPVAEGHRPLFRRRDRARHQRIPL